MRNIRLAFRTLFRTPFVTAVAILSLALGIGANAAIFSLFNQMILSALPVAEPERLVNLIAPGPKPGSTSCNQAGDCEAVFSYPMYRDLERAQLPLGLAAHRLFGANLAYGGESLSGEGLLVSGSYFPVLRLQPQHGRLLGPADDETPGAHPVAVVSHAFWTTRLGSDPGVVGRTITISGTPFEIVGVAPEGFNGTTLGGRPHVFVPITMREQASPNWGGLDNRRSYWVYVFGRLGAAATLAQAEAALNAVYAPIINDVEVPLQEGMSEATLARFREKRIAVEDGRRGQSQVHAEARTPLLLMFATAGIVLLIACANIANLLLARGANRGMEMAVRLSLGANRPQVVGQLIVEALVLALLGGVASLVVAHWTLAGIAAILPSEATETLALEVNLPVAAFAAALAMLTGLLFGLFPALHSTRPELVSTIRSNAGNLTVTRGAVRFRTTLVTAQIALSMSLLIVAGLFLKSLVNVSRVDLGVRIENIVTFGIAPEANGYEEARSRQIFERVEQELAALPGVTSVASALVPLLSGSNWSTSVSAEGFQGGPDVDSNSRLNQVGPHWFGTFDVPILAGRGFTAADNESGPRVAIVNEAFVEKFGLGRAAVGKRMSPRGSGRTELDVEIVGVVPNVAYSQVKDEARALFFTPWRQNERVGTLFFYVRSPLPPEQVIASVRALVRNIDPMLPVDNLKTMPQQVRENIFMDRMISTLSATFAGLATLLAAIGLYGVLAYTVATRTREIGVRMALGASSAKVRGMVLGHVLRVLAVGGIIGVTGAYFIGRAAGSILYGMQGTDPVVFTGAATLLALFALAAGYLPAHRAARVEPMQALRYE